MTGAMIARTDFLTVVFGVESKMNRSETLAQGMAQKLGTPMSIGIHAAYVGAIVSLWFFGIEINTVLLLLTTVITVEGIFIQLFNQISTNCIQDKIQEGESS